MLLPSMITIPQDKHTKLQRREAKPLPAAQAAWNRVRCTVPMRDVHHNCGGIIDQIQPAPIRQKSITKPPLSRSMAMTLTSATLLILLIQTLLFSNF